MDKENENDTAVITFAPVTAALNKPRVELAKPLPLGNHNNNSKPIDADDDTAKIVFQELPASKEVRAVRFGLPEGTRTVKPTMRRPLPNLSKLGPPKRMTEEEAQAAADISFSSLAAATAAVDAAVSEPSNTQAVAPIATPVVAAKPAASPLPKSNNADEGDDDVSHVISFQLPVPRMTPTTVRAKPNTYFTPTSAAAATADTPVSKPAAVKVTTTRMALPTAINASGAAAKPNTTGVKFTLATVTNAAAAASTSAAPIAAPLPTSAPTSSPNPTAPSQAPAPVAAQPVQSAPPQMTIVPVVAAAKPVESNAKSGAAPIAAHEDEKTVSFPFLPPIPSFEELREKKLKAAAEAATSNTAVPAATAPAVVVKPTATVVQTVVKLQAPVVNNTAMAAAPSAPVVAQVKAVPQPQSQEQQRQVQAPVQASSSAVMPAAQLAQSQVAENSTPQAVEKKRNIAQKSDATPEAPRQVKTKKADAAHNTVVVNSITYLILEKIGQGGSSQVYKVMGPKSRIFACKVVSLSENDIVNCRNEVRLLQRLFGKPNIIQLFAAEEKDGHLLMIFEFGEIDLSRLLQKSNGRAVSENYLRMYWQQMLEAVQTIHEERIVHADLKPANFMVVEGSLKLIDFGLAKAIGNDTANIVRDELVGSLNYISPEAILDCPGGGESGVGFNEIGGNTGHKLGRPADVWSLGCILYQMAYGKPPFHDVPGMKKIIVIPDSRYAIKFPDQGNPFLIDVLKRCLQRDPSARPTIPDLLAHAFLNPTAVLQQQQQQLLLAQQQAVAAAPAPAPAESMQRKQVQSLLEQMAQLTGRKDLLNESVLDAICAQVANGQEINLMSVMASASELATKSEPVQSKPTAAASVTQQLKRVTPLPSTAAATNAAPAAPVSFTERDLQSRRTALADTATSASVKYMKPAQSNQMADHPMLAGLQKMRAVMAPEKDDESVSISWKS